MERLNKTGEQLIYLISCALRRADADEAVLDTIEPSGLFALAQAHSVSAMVCMVLEKTAVFAQSDPTVQKQWLDAKNKAIRKTMLLDAQRELLMNDMEAAGIWHMPLKGCVLKDLYPQYGMREMADNDLLFDETKREQVKEIFLRHGYSAEVFNKSNHDVYTKPPVYNFEMHTSLFSETEYEDAAKAHAPIRQTLLSDADKPYRLRFTPEDFYLFAVAHAYKHFHHRGTGVRTLADLYVMQHTIGQSMDRRYVDKELDALSIRDYEENSRLLSEKLFGSDKPLSALSLTPKEQQFLLFHLKAGTYGTVETRVRRELHSMQTEDAPISGFTKLKYCLLRLFPGPNWCKDKYPFVYRHPYVLPAFWVWRLFKKIPGSRKKVQEEVSVLKSS